MPRDTHDARRRVSAYQHVHEEVLQWLVGMRRGEGRRERVEKRGAGQREARRLTPFWPIAARKGPRAATSPLVWPRLLIPPYNLL